jgi:hypothetical protein
LNKQSKNKTNLFVLILKQKKVNLPFDRERQCAVAGATETDLGQRNRVSHDAVIDVVQVFGTQS